MGTINPREVPSLKPITCVYDPNPGFLPVFRQLPGFLFLQWGNKNEEHLTDNSIEVNPSSLGVPWPSSFPVARQSKHWSTATQSAENLIRELHPYSSGNGNKLPGGLFVKAGSVELSEKGKAFASNSAVCASYMNPEANSRRVCLIARAYLLLWLLDDIIELYPEMAGFTAIDDFMADYPMVIRNSGLQPEQVSGYASDLIDEDPILGREVLGALLDWSCEFRKKTRESFTDFNDFLDYRKFNVGDSFVFACTRFAMGTRLSPVEVGKLSRFTSLAGGHLAVINDIYSFDKENQDFQDKGAIFLNTVEHLRGILSIGPQAAKGVAFQLTMEWESVMEKELGIMNDSAMFNRTQLRFAQGLLGTLAGNIFYSATSARYAQYSALCQ